MSKEDDNTQDEAIKLLAGLLTDELNYIFSESLPTPPKIVVYAVNDNNTYGLDVFVETDTPMKKEIEGWAKDWVEKRMTEIE